MSEWPLKVYPKAHGDSNRSLRGDLVIRAVQQPVGKVVADSPSRALGLPGVR